MRNRFKLISMAALAALTLTALAVQEGYLLKRAPKVDESSKFRMKAEMEFQGAPIVFTALVTEKVTKVDENGNYALSSLMSDAKVNMSGNEMDVPDSGGSTVTTYSAAGRVLDLKGENSGPEAMRLAHLQSLEFPSTPLKVGDTWKSSIKKDEKGSVDSEGSYKVEAMEKIGEWDTLKITGKFKELGGAQPASAEGTYWVSIKDGSLVKLDGKLKNAPFPDPIGVIDAKVTMTREK